MAAERSRRSRADDVRAQLEGGADKDKKQTNVAIDTPVYERMEKYISERKVKKGELVTAALDLLLDDFGY